MGTIICTKCEKKFEVEQSIGNKHRQNLCPKCWKEARKNCWSKEDKRCGKGSIKGQTWFNTKSNCLSFSKRPREEILKRNSEIDRLNKIIDRLAKENINLKEEVIVLRLR